ncbi:hypothetical protein QE152_g1888 [Popillia japonica]|uniref:Uncharacterized protein n=1 Tax=Popillia japonica TaxID=7064 RepID=A0AAW1N157_POPJA
MSITFNTHTCIGYTGGMCAPYWKGGASGPNQTADRQSNCVRRVEHVFSFHLQLRGKSIASRDSGSKKRGALRVLVIRRLPLKLQLFGRDRLITSCPSFHEVGRCLI